MYRSQQGAALIVVLIMLILITAVGVLSVRQSGTDLRVATNDQVETLLLNSSDSVQSHLEQAVDFSKNKDEYNQLISAAGAFGYFMNAPGEANRGDQIILCYNPRQEGVFKLSNASILTPEGGSKFVGGATNDGYCNVTVKNDYTSARHTAMTQLMITRPKASKTPSKAFDGVSKGRDVNIINPTAAEPLFEMYSSAIIPAMAKASNTEMNDCFKKPVVDPSRFKYDDKDDSGNDIQTPFAQTLPGCMQNEGAPSKVIIEQVRMRNTNISDICIDFGKGAGAVSNGCQQKYSLNADGTPKS